MFCDINLPRTSIIALWSRRLKISSRWHPLTVNGNRLRVPVIELKRDSWIHQYWRRTKLSTSIRYRTLGADELNQSFGKVLVSVNRIIQNLIDHLILPQTHGFEMSNSIMSRLTNCFFIAVTFTTSKNILNTGTDSLVAV